MELIDTHVHLNFEVFQSDLDDLRQRWQQANVVQLVHSCVTPTEFSAIAELSDKLPELSFAVGLHPLDVAEHWRPALADTIQSLATSHPKVVAIGETGLDFFKATNRAEQVESLKSQLLIAQSLDLPVIIHCRDAAAELKEFLDSFFNGYGPVKGVMHCWSGAAQQTQWFLDFGFYISFSGIITFKNAHTVRASASIVPLERLLVETDCPFLAPVPHRGKRNEPSFVRNVAEHVAELRQVSLESLAQQTTENARRLFRLAPLLTSSSPASVV
ncbi:MAG: TatD family hydrolase [Cyanobacteria bacterium P01_H01_bin.15]